MVSCPVSTRTRRPYPSSICGYRATPTDVSPIANLCRIIMPVHRLWSPRTRRYADLISCFESGLSQWIMGLDTAPLSCSLISFSEDLLSSFIGRPRSHATVRSFSIFKTGFVAFVFPICRGNRVSSFPSFFFFFIGYSTRILTNTVFLSNQRATYSWNIGDKVVPDYARLQFSLTWEPWLNRRS